MLIKIPRPWALPDSAVTPESVFARRKGLVRGLAEQGLVGRSPRPGLIAPTRRQVLAMSAASLGLAGCGLSVEGLDLGQLEDLENPWELWFPAPRNGAYTVDERPLTDPFAATTYNNFYEFSWSKSEVVNLVGAFEIAPWSVEVTGLCRKGGVFGLEDLLSLFDLEERVYRFRCVEAWAMTVPWSGFPLAALLEHVDPLPEATHVAFTSANDPEQMPGVDAVPTYPWPYTEGLRLDEAANELTFMAGGLYGHALQRQNGAPLRLIVPWKYGYKSIKSIVRIELTDRQPPTFWSTLVPGEYPFESNVDPEVPHPRWSQATERLIPGGEEVPTQKYNGYAEQVAALYR